MQKLSENYLGLKLLWVLFIIVAIVITYNLIQKTNQLKIENMLEKRDDIAMTVSVTEAKVSNNTTKKVSKPNSTPKATNHQPNVNKKETKSQKEVTKESKNNKKKKSNKKKTKSTKSAKRLEVYSSVSDSDKKLMEKVVYAESRGESFEGQVAVAAVICNRYVFYKQQKSIADIVTKPYQFADISGVTQEMLDKYPNCAKAVEEAMNGNDPTKAKFPEGARYFYEPNLVSGHQKEIREGIEVLKIGNHNFHNDFNK